MLITMSAPTRQPRTTRYELVEKQAQALTMRNAGASVERIAAHFNISVNTAEKWLSKAIAHSVRIPAAQMIDKQRAILLDILRVEYPAALDVTSPRHYQAQDKILEALQHEAKLFGLYAPARINVGISEQEFARQAVELLKVTGNRPLLQLAKTVDDTIDVEAQPTEDDDDGGESWSNL